MKKNDLFFLFFLIVIVLVFNFVYIRNINTNNLQNYSSIENRMYNTFDDMKLEGFFTRSLQTKFETSLSDQFLYAEKIRLNYNNNSIFLDYLNISKNVCKNNYVHLGPITATFNCSDTLIYDLNDRDIKIKKDNYSYNFTLFNELNKISDVYFYYINTSCDYDFERTINKTNIASVFDSYFEDSYKLKQFEVDNYEEYEEYTYKTDHHWNQDASYKGYTDVIEFLNNEEAKPIEKTYYLDDTNFYGYMARQIKYFGIKEKIKYHYVNVGEFTAYIDGKESWLDSSPLYTEDNYSRDEYFYHYAYLSGNNHAEKIIDFHNEDKENLLVFSDSFTNAMLPLIASHFNKTYAIDHRYVEEKINLVEYIKKYNITKVLVVFSNYTFEEKIEKLEVK